MEQTYNKPQLKFISLESEKTIADKCWGNHGTGYKYYDTAGAGYVAFTIKAGSCTAAGDALEMYYYDSKGDTNPERIYPGDSHYDEAFNKLVAVSGGSYAQPFKGQENFPDSPSGMS